MMLVTLPFRNLDDGDDYFSDGLTEEIITQLGRLGPERLRVIAPTSAMAYKNSGKTVEQIASELDVDYVLEGGVRRSGDRVRISVQLTDARDQTQLWSTSYERQLADVLEAQNELGRRVARSLALELMPGQHAILARASTTNPAAYTSYLKGRYHLSRLSQADLQASRSYFAEAVEKDPDYALAYVGLADSSLMLGVHNWVPRGDALQEAKRATLEALSIDDTLGEAYASRGLLKYWYEWDWLGAERDFQRALALTPNYSSAHEWYGALLGDLRRFDQALEEGRISLELDPRAQDVNLLMVKHLYHSRRMDEAMNQARALVKMSPAFAKAHRMLGWVYVQKEMYQEALREFEDAVRLSDGDPSYEAPLAYLAAVSGRRADAERMLASLETTTRNTPVYDIARIYTALDAPEVALDWLDRAYEVRHIALTRLQVDPMLDELRSHPRYHQLVEKMGFPPIP
jgi:TolB-like protein/Tfp pilus assembly protein PilF